ncbi:MAG: AraC family transcriptional regulator [Lachnospiraceae bacterium]|nr:AraC family transcriptional regulator [Lachnospiraceae bacterium]
MSKNGKIYNGLPIENIVHRTASRPFSLYRTVVGRGDPCALYLHCHPEAEIFYLEQGAVEFQVENRSFLLKTGEGIFIPPNQIHTATNKTDETLSCCHRAFVFDLDLLEQNLPPYCQIYFAPLKLWRTDCIYPVTLDKKENSRLLALFPSIFSLPEPGLKLEQYELSLIGTLFLCWQELYNLCFSRLNRSVSDNALRREIQKSLDFLQENFSDSFTLSELSKRAGLSESYFSHSFKSCTGHTPFEYLNRLRIVKSCEMLIRTDKKITEIASLCGFNNISYFNRTFHKIMGISPSGYRGSPDFQMPSEHLLI